jgi:hypothetical protein
MASRLSAHACPRCGYDVSGVVPTWAEKCPLEGTCSECGLVYAWVDVFRPERIAPPWSFEHARGDGGRRWFASVGRSLVPTRFWSDLRLGAPLRPARLMLIVLPLLIVGWLVVMGCAARFGYSLWMVYNTPVAGGLPFGVPPSFRGVQWLGEPWDSSLTLAIWPWTRVPWVGSVLDGPPMFGLLWGLLAPLPFLVLGQSLSRAKCRRMHLLRGWVYQWPGLLPIVGMELVVRAWGSRGSWGALALVGNERVAASMLLVWMAVFWWAFTGRYLRLPRAWLVAAAMLVISAMLVLVVDWLVSPAHESMVDAIGSMLACHPDGKVRHFVAGSMDARLL